jgi:hypothetical protein
LGTYRGLVGTSDGGPLRRSALIVGAVALVAGAFGLGRLSADDEPSSEALPRCSELQGQPADDEAAGCLTSDGAALQSYRFECGTSAEPPAADPAGEAAAESSITFIPDAGLVGASGEPWRRAGQGGRLAAFHRTPFLMLRADECAWLRSIPSDWPARPGCDLDEVRIDPVSLQGCETDQGYHPAVGRRCTYQDGDVRASWEQWWLGPSPAAGAPAPALETAGPPETWTLIAPTHRDDRCRVAPRDWPQEWRAP